MPAKIDEGEWIALVTRIEEAMAIHPFMPRQEDVITLLSMAANGNQHAQRVDDLERVVERLRAALVKISKQRQLPSNYIAVEVALNALHRPDEPV